VQELLTNCRREVVERHRGCKRQEEHKMLSSLPLLDRRLCHQRLARGEVVMGTRSVKQISSTKASPLILSSAQLGNVSMYFVTFPTVLSLAEGEK
jgi:hypothetical protein